MQRFFIVFFYVVGAGAGPGPGVDTMRPLRGIVFKTFFFTMASPWKHVVLYGLDRGPVLTRCVRSGVSFSKRFFCRGRSMKGCVHGSLLDISIEDVMKLSADRPIARCLSQNKKIGLPRLMQSFKTYSLPEIVCSLRPPACLCAKCDAVHSRAPNCMRFVRAQRF